MIRASKKAQADDAFKKWPQVHEEQGQSVQEVQGMLKRDHDKPVDINMEDVIRVTKAAQAKAAFRHWPRHVVVKETLAGTRIKKVQEEQGLHEMVQAKPVYNNIADVIHASSPESNMMSAPLQPTSYYRLPVREVPDVPEVPEMGWEETGAVARAGEEEAVTLSLPFLASFPRAETIQQMIRLQQADWSTRL
jgi:hypothetical protein